MSSRTVKEVLMRADGGGRGTAFALPFSVLVRFFFCHRKS